MWYQGTQGTLGACRIKCDGIWHPKLTQVIHWFRYNPTRLLVLISTLSAQ